MEATTMILIWLGIVILTLIIEILTQALTTIWFSIGATVAAIAVPLGAPIWLQIALFAVISVIVMILARPLARKVTATTLTPTNADSLIGREATVCTAIKTAENTGRVSIRDLEWLARSEDGSDIPEGERVTILRIEGVKLIVKRNNA